jgi:hypothetical protein
MAGAFADCRAWAPAFPQYTLRQQPLQASPGDMRAKKQPCSWLNNQTQAGQKYLFLIKQLLLWKQAV